MTTSWSPTAAAGRNSLSRFSPPSTQLYHGISQYSTRVPADFYGKIDQLANKKRSPTTSPNTSPTSEPNYERVHSTRAERLLPGYNNLSKPSSTKVDPLLPNDVYESEQIYERVNHPIGFSMSVSLKEREAATSWDELISSEPTIARHTTLKTNVRNNSNTNSRASNDSISSSSSTFRPIPSQRRTEQYQWEGPSDGTLDTELWRVPPQSQSLQYQQFLQESLEQEQKISLIDPMNASINPEYGKDHWSVNQSLGAQEDNEEVLGTFVPQCFATGSMSSTMENVSGMSTMEKELRRRKLLETRKHETKQENQSFEKISSRDGSEIPHDKYIHHDQPGDASAGARRHSDGLSTIISIGPDGSYLGSFSDTNNTNVDMIDKLSTRKECDKLTGTYRSKKWGAGGGGMSEPLGESMNAGSSASSAEAPKWMTSNCEKIVPGSLVHQKDRMLQFDMREYPLKEVAFRGIGGVNLTSRSVSNDLPIWMVEHRNNEYPATVVRRPEQQWSPYNQKAKRREKEKVGKFHKLTLSGDAPTWMTEQNRRIDKSNVLDPPMNYSGKYGEKTFVNRNTQPSYRNFPVPHYSEVRGLARRTKGRGVKDIPVKGAVNERPDQKLHLNGKDAWVPNCSMFGVQDTHGYLKVHGENM